MRADRAGRIEQVVDAGAAAVVAAAAGYCALRLSWAPAIAAVGAVVALCCGFGVLRLVRPEERHFQLPAFAPLDLTVWPDELALDEDEPVVNCVVGESPELLLEDVLAELAPDSRVVRLFDAAAMPTPGELRARIDRHLGSARVSAVPPAAAEADASQALHEALAELRRSLR